MIRCLAIDDESYATKIIADYVAKVPFLEMVGTTTNAIEALSMIQKEKIDLIFLDIQMPDITGLQFLKLLGGKCKVILTTAYPEYALEGYEHDVVDYLLKPISFDRFLKAANKALTIFSPPNNFPEIQNEHINHLNQNNTFSQDYLFVKGESKNKFLKVNYNDILYVEGLKNYVSVFVDKQRIVTYQTLRELETQLPKPPFYRVHKSYIVSINKINLIDGNILSIGNQTIPIGETYRDEFFKLIKEKK